MCTYAQFSNLEPFRGRGASIEARKRLRSISYYTLQRYCQFLNMDSHSQQTLAYLLLSAGIQWNTHIHNRLWRICCCRLAYSHSQQTLAYLLLSAGILTFTTDFGVFVVVGWHTHIHNRLWRICCCRLAYSHSQQTLAYLLLSAGILTFTTDFGVFVVVGWHTHIHNRLWRICCCRLAYSHSQQTLAYLLLSAGIQWNTHIHNRLWRICCCQLAYSHSQQTLAYLLLSADILTFTTDFSVFVVVSWHTVESAFTILINFAPATTFVAMGTCWIYNQEIYFMWNALNVYTLHLFLTLYTK